MQAVTASLAARTRDIAGKRRDDPLGVRLIVDAGEAEADRHARMVGERESGLMQRVANHRAPAAIGGGEIDMDVGRGAKRLRERAALAVLDPHATPRRAAVDADEPRGASVTGSAPGAARSPTPTPPGS